MEMYIWDNYKNDEMTAALKYWVDVWEDLIANNNKNSYGISFVSPHLILLDIIDEIELNSFKNKEVKKFYQRKINEYVKDNSIIKSEFQTGFQLIRKEFDGPNHMYLSQLCKEMAKGFKSGKFFRECYSRLKQLLLASGTSSDDFETIKRLTGYLIIELVMVGYDLQSIRKIPIHLLSTYEYYDDNHITTKYPHRVKIEDFKLDNDEVDYKAYNNAVKEEIDRVTITERLDCLLSYFFKEKEMYIYIFNIEGLIGIGDWIIRDVHFYSPVEITYIQDSFRDKKELHEEFFHGTEENHYINAAVQVEVLDVASGKIKAVEKIEKALDMIRCYYTSEVNFEVITEEYYVVDKNGRNISSSFTVSKRQGWYKWHSSFLMDRVSEDFFNMANHNSINDSSSQTTLENKISQSLRWYRKAEEAPTMEDKLLAYWIVIENFMNVSEDAIAKMVNTKEKSSKFLLAREVIAALDTKTVFYQYGWELFHYLRRLTSSSQGGRKFLSLSEEIMEKTGLNIEQGKVYLQPFINNLDSLEMEVTRDIIKEKISIAKKFYKNENQLQKTMLETWKKNTEDEMLLLYRLRNKIVHNAHYDYTILPFYEEKARIFAGQILRYAVEQHYQDSSIDLESLSLKAIVEINIMMERLKNNETLDIEL